MGITNFKKSLLGNIKFSFSGDDFCILRIASGRGVSGVSSYPVLEMFTRPCSRLIIGNSESGKFTRGKFLILPKHKIVQVRDLNVLIGADDELMSKRLEDFLQKNPFIIPVLFEKPFSHLTISSRIDVGGWKLFKRKTVLSYTGLPESVIKNSHELEIFLKSIQLIKHHLSI